MNTISINIWDDYYDDGYVPEGEIQETYIYVEEDISQEERKSYLEFLLKFMNENLNLDGVKMWMELYESRKKYPNLVGNPDAEKMFFDRWEIRIENMTHRRLERLVEELNDVELKFNEKLLSIYSES